MTAKKNEEMTAEEAKTTTEQETVTVPKSEFEDLKKTVAMLKETADVGRVANYEAKHKGKLAQHGRVSVVGDRVVVGWKMKEDFVGKLPNGQWVERQIITLKMDDDTEADMNYSEFVKIKKMPCEIVSRSFDEISEILTLKVKLDDGREITLKGDGITIAFN